MASSAASHVAKILITADSSQAQREFKKLNTHLLVMKKQFKATGGVIGSLFGKGKGDLSYLKNISAHMGTFKKSMGGTTGIMSKLSSGIATVGYGLGALGVAAGYAGVKTIQAAASFEEAIDAIIVQTKGIPDKVIKDWGDQILATAGKYSVSAEEMAGAALKAASAGAKQSKVMEIVNISAKMATAGMGKAADVARVLTIAQNNYGTAALSASKAGDILTAAMEVGAADADEYASTLGAVLGSAQALGVSFGETAGAVALMTNKSGSAAESVTALNAMFQVLLKPSTQATAALEEVGLSAEELRDSLDKDGIISTLQKLDRAFEGDRTKMAQVFREVRGLKAVYGLLNGDMAKNRRTVKQVANAHGNLNVAYKESGKSAKNLWKRAMVGLHNIMIQLGEAALPQVIKLLKGFNRDVLPGISKWLKGNKDGLKNYFKSAYDAVKKLWPQIKEAAKSVGDLITWCLNNQDAIKTMFEIAVAPARALLELINSIRGTGAGGAQAKGGKGGAVSSKREVDSSLTGVTTTVRPPKRHSGGIVEGPHSGYGVTLHGTEAVLPLDHPGKIPGILAQAGIGGGQAASGVTVNVYGPIVGTGPGSADALARLVTRAIQQRSIRVARGYA